MWRRRRSPPCSRRDWPGDDSTSIDWAREMRGRNSMAKATDALRRPAPAIAAFSLWGASSAASTAPFFISADFAGLGPAHLQHDIGIGQRGCGIGRDAGARPRYNRHRRYGRPAPAPVSTTTSRPRPLNFLTDSGVAATRVSPSRRSLGTASFILQPPTRLAVGPEDGEEDHDQEDEPAATI